MNEFTISIAVFLAVYALIMSEKFNRMVVSLFGAAILIGTKIFTQREALKYVDSDTIILLLSMMIIVNIMKYTGIFEYIAIKIAKSSNNSAIKIMIMFSLFTAVSSAFLDNVTTILLVTPVTIVIAKQLKVNPVYFVIPEVLLANIGGTATLIGDPPNIMIGSQVGLGFMDFIYYLAPIILVAITFVCILFLFMFKKHLQVDHSHFKEIMKLNENLAIKDKKLLMKSGIIMLLTILGFLIGHHIGLESSEVAFLGATTLLFISKVDPEELVMDIEWTTIFFFVGLFILVGGLEKTGVIDLLAKELLALSKDNLFMMTMFVLWGAAIISAFLDNIPFVATMIPLIQTIGQNMNGVDITPIWWALALGACLGGNGTIIGASANVIAVGILEKQKHKISFLDFMKVGFPIMILCIILSTIYLKIRFF